MGGITSSSSVAVGAGLSGNGTPASPLANTGVTSAVAGNGITVSGATGAVTINQDFYTGSTPNISSYAIGTYISILGAGGTPYVNGTSPTIYSPTGSGNTYFVNNGSQGGGSVALAGTWRGRGMTGVDSSLSINYALVQRTA